MNQHGLLLDFQVHPAADVFPMLGDDELRDLAEDIKASGLIHPIVLDEDGVLIDGRNRLAACNLAGVEPTFETFAGDPVVYIISANVNRRDMRPGQKAMALADVLVTFDPDQKYGRQGGLARAGGIAAATLSRAMTVREYADLADQVRLGASLKDAYVAAVERNRRRDGAQEAAEKQFAYIQEQHQKAVERIEAARASLGPRVKVPPEPELEVRLSRTEDGEVKMPSPERGLGDNLKREQALHRRLQAVKREIEALATEPPMEDVWYFEGHVMAVRSWASQVVAGIYGMVESHNAALGMEEKLRRVK